MSRSILNSVHLPYCKGCGHGVIARHTAKALEDCGYHPLDVVSVTDIGCHGIIDKCLSTHTVHGLHGRSTALAAGIAMGIEEPGKKVVVFIGDGGATIGLQHILEAARLNLNMTVLVHNNMLYGMTGGQTSGFTPDGFSTTTSADGNPFPPYDICALAASAGATYVSRMLGNTDISVPLAEAFRAPGFSLVEVLAICPSYGASRNPGRKLREISASAGRPPGRWVREPRPGLPEQGRKTRDLLADLESVKPQFSPALDRRVSVVLSGSAGEGVQLASTLLAKAAMLSGYSVTQKGSYPVTVGVGFSAAEVNIAPGEIHFHGIGQPDFVVITSLDGLDHMKGQIGAMTGGVLFLDESLPVPATGARLFRHDFRGVGGRNAAVYSLFVLARETGILDIEALFRGLHGGRLAEKLPHDVIRARLAGALDGAPVDSGAHPGGAISGGFDVGV